MMTSTSISIRQAISAVMGLCLTALAYGQATVTVDGNTTYYQTIRGWGGNTYSWILNGWNGWSNDEVYEIAFNELGTTHLRLVAEFECWEPENDDNDPHHFNWPYFASRFQQADNKAVLLQSNFNMMHKITNEFGKKLMIGIWNVPDWMVRDSTRKDHRDLPSDLVNSAPKIVTFLDTRWRGADRKLQDFAVRQARLEVVE